MHRVTCALLIFTLSGCGTLPKEKFLLKNNDARRTYELNETSILALRFQMASEATQVLWAYASLTNRFSNNVELIEYVDLQSQRVQDNHDKQEQILLKLEEKMSPGRTLYLFGLVEGKRHTIGKLILDRKGNLVWREIESANYPFWEEKSSAAP